MNRIMLLIAMVVCAMGTNAQLGAPINSHKDTFYIQRVIYNGTELNTSDWPSSFIEEDAVNIYIAQFTYEKGRLVHSHVNGYEDCNGQSTHLVKYYYRAKCNGSNHDVYIEKSEDGNADCHRKYTIGDYVFDVLGRSSSEKKMSAVENDDVYIEVDVDAMFPGGIEALYKYLAQNVEYPREARLNNITGRVYVEFVVRADGTIDSVKVLRDIGGGCGQEAVRVVQSMPKWIPGKINGESVNMRYRLPINFSLK